MRIRTQRNVRVCCENGILLVTLPMSVFKTLISQTHRLMEWIHKLKGQPYSLMEWIHKLIGQTHKLTKTNLTSIL